MLMEEPLPDDVRTQGDFDDYIKNLPPKVQCKYMLSTVVNLCSRPEMECPFRGEEVYSFAHGPKRECKRPHVLHMRQILGVK
jgi:hypothetical protein